MPQLWVVYNPRLHSGCGGPTSIPCTVQYIVVKSLLTSHCIFVAHYIPEGVVSVVFAVKEWNRQETLHCILRMFGSPSDLNCLTQVDL